MSGSSETGKFLVVEKFHLELSGSYPYHVLATRYTTNGSANIRERDGYTLILTHAVGTHKETWEITIQHLLGLCNASRSSYSVKEIYSIENPNHSESALLNADIIEARSKDTWSTMEYVHAVEAFLSAGTHRGACVDFSKRKLVGIGHSAGAVALFLSHSLTPRIPWITVIAMDPAFSPASKYPGRSERTTMLQRWVWLLRRAWASKKDAFEDLQQTRVFDEWDARVLRLYVEHALSDHPASKIPPPFTFDGVITSTTKSQEAASYRCDDLTNGTAFKQLREMYAELPVHLIWGERDDVMSNQARKLVAMPDPETGSAPATVRYVQGTGHMLVQQEPELIAVYIHEILSSMHTAVAAL